MEDIRWKKFKLSADYNIDLRSLYLAWATPAGLEQWFLRKADFNTVSGRLRGQAEQIAKEDTYEWHWHGYDNNVVQKGVVLEANGHDFIKFSFTENTIVNVSFSTRYGLTIVDLEQTDIPQETDPAKNLLVQCQIGWTFYLANLKSVMEGCKDLRNRRIELMTCFK